MTDLELGIASLKKWGHAFDMYAGEFYGYHPVDLFCDTGLCESRNEARRMLKQGSLKTDGHTFTNEPLGFKKFFEPPTYKYMILMAGKKKRCLIDLDYSDHVFIKVIK